MKPGPPHSDKSDGAKRSPVRVETPRGAVVVRRAGPEDAPVLARLIVGLARYERLEAHCVPDPVDLRSHLAPDAQPRLEALLAEPESGGAIGFALFFYHYSTFLSNWGLYLEDLFVEPDYRGRGIGYALLQQVARLAVDNRCVRLEWSVLDWNEPARAFYRRLGAEELSDWKPMRLTGEALRRLAENAAGNPSG